MNRSSKMDHRIEKLKLEEIHLVRGIDRSEETRAEYVCAPTADGLGLTLIRRELDTPRVEANWGDQEIASRCALWAENIKDGAAMFGAFRGEGLIGFCIVARVDDPRTSELYSVFVDRRSRERGVGKALLCRAERQSVEWGCEEMVLYTGYAAATMEFYLACGYRIVGIQDAAVKSKNFPLTMAKRLGGCAAG